MGWVHGGGTPVGILAEMLAASLNANLGGRDHIPIEVERQIVRWMQTIFSFPQSAGGLFVTGASMANLIGVLIARDVALGYEVRCTGVAAPGDHQVDGQPTPPKPCIPALPVPWISVESAATLSV